MRALFALTCVLMLIACSDVDDGEARASHGGLKRLATLPVGAEVTGLFLHRGDLFFNAPHPLPTNAPPFSRATIGVIANADFDAPAHAVPQGADRRRVSSALGRYQVLARPGDGGTIGVIEGVHGRITTSPYPDFNAFLPTGTGQGYLFTAWEDRPGGMSRMALSRAADGTWTVDPDSREMLDFQPVHGTWRNCFGTLSPWGTPLSSEEFEVVNTRDWFQPRRRLRQRIAGLTRYLGHRPNPYRYGYIVEITDPTGAARPVKRVALGRFAHENAVVMPDWRTVYLSDDVRESALFKFVADRRGDLSSGTLYAAKVTQDTAPGREAGETGFDIAWVRLAHGREAEIEAWIAEYDRDGPYQPGVSSPAFVTDAEIADWAAGRAPDDRAAFLESRKAAAALGASVEFRKIEGINMNPAAIAAGQPALYMAVSHVTHAMSDRRGDIQLARNPCGAVYRLTFDGTYSVTRMDPILAGGPFMNRLGVNACATDNIANPDNIVVRDNGDVIIGEDSAYHLNNAIWLWRATMP